MPESLCELAPEGKLRQSFKGLSFLQALMISLNYNLGFSVASAGWVGYAILSGACFVTLTTGVPMHPHVQRPGQNGGARAVPRLAARREHRNGGVPRVPEHGAVHVPPV